MRGLREKAGKKFEAYFVKVQEAAAKKGCVYFCDTTEGNAFSDGEMEGENLAGWLVPEAEADAFEKDFLDEEIDMKWDSAYHFALWKKEKDGGIGVQFLHYSMMPHDHDCGHGH